MSLSKAISTPHIFTPMGNSLSSVKQHLYILKVSNLSLPLCPFIHTIIGFNDRPVSDTDPRVFREILSSSDLVLEIMDIRDSSTFRVCVPQGTERLGLNVIKLKDEVSLLNVRVTNVRDGSCFRASDQILGIENVYLETEEQLINHIKNNVGSNAVLVLARDECVVTEKLELKSDMGCEIGVGILYKPSPVDYYMSAYDQKIKRLYDEGGDKIRTNTQDDQEARSAVKNDAPDIANGKMLPENKDGDQTVQNKIEKGATSVQIDQFKNLGIPKVEGGRPPKEEDRQETSNQLPAASSKTCTAVHTPDEIESNSNNRICNEIGLSPEAKYVQGEKDLHQEGAVLVNDTFAHKDDFINDSTGLRMKEEAFNKRKRMHEDKVEQVEPSQEKLEACLNGERIFIEDEEKRLLPRDDSAEEQSHSMRNIFDDTDENDRLPFEQDRENRSLARYNMADESSACSAPTSLKETSNIPNHLSVTEGSPLTSHHAVSSTSCYSRSEGDVSAPLENFQETGYQVGREGRGEQLFHSQESSAHTDVRQKNNGYDDHGQEDHTYNNGSELENSPAFEQLDHYHASFDEQAKHVPDNLPRSDAGKQDYEEQVPCDQPAPGHGEHSRQAGYMQFSSGHPTSTNMLEDEQSIPSGLYESSTALNKGDSSATMPILFDDIPTTLYSDDNSKSLSTPAINQNGSNFDMKDVNKSVSDSELL